MTNHKVVLEIAKDGRHYASCSCRAASKLHEHRWQAEDWRNDHLALIERIKVHMGAGRSVSLKAAYEHYCRMAQDPDVTDYDRRLWEQLRDELGKRLGVEHAPEEQQALPFEVEKGRDRGTTSVRSAHPG